MEKPFDNNNCNNSLLGIGDWGLGNGDWGLGRAPNPRSTNTKNQTK